MEESGEKRGAAYSLNALGGIAQERGDLDTAQTFFAESLSVFRELGDKTGIAYSLEGIAFLRSAQARTAQAARLWGMAECLRETNGSPLLLNEQAHHARRTAHARAVLGEEAFAAASTEGREMSLEAVFAYGLA